MSAIENSVSDDPAHFGPSSKQTSNSSGVDGPTLMDTSSITANTHMPGWSFGVGTTQLMSGTRLFEYEVTGTIGQGGFGIVYRAEDRQLGRKVAIKEYLPATMALRSDSGGVTLASQSHANAFEAGLSSFVNEARLLAQFDHPALVKVFRFWEANGTAYMVMPLYDGVTLKQYLHDHPDVSQRWLENLLDTLLDALDTLHQAHVFHRDIAPDNILILKDGRPVLLDFGAARQRIGEMTHGMTVIVKPGYAPIEQYAGDASAKQGAWTDIYALAAVMYYAITRKVPPASVSRVVEDSLEPLASIRPAGFNPLFLEALDRALRIERKQRPQSVPELRALLGRGRDIRPVKPAQRTGTRSIYLSYAAIGVAMLALSAIGWRILHKPDAAKDVYVSVQQPTAQQPPTPLENKPGAQGEQRPAEHKPEPPVQPPVMRPAFSPAGALHEVAAMGNPSLAPTVTVPKARVIADRDRVEFTLDSPIDGYLYILMYDTDGKLYLLFPNAIDKSNRVSAHSAVHLPRAGWSIVATPPYGTNRLLAIVSQTRRDFGAAGLVPAGDFNEFRLDAAKGFYERHQDTWPFLSGRPECAEPCASAFGAAEFNVEVVRK
jgi:serine/threonine protein kinase